jgi:hypothetical protein
MGGYGTQYGIASYGYEDIGAPPVLRNLDPQANETGVFRDENIILEVYDDITGVDEDSIIIRVDGVTAWQNDTQQVGFSVAKTIISNGFRYEINPDDLLANYAWINIEVYAESFGSEVLDEIYQFQTRDEIGPSLSNFDPGRSERYVESDRPIIFDLTDNQGVNADSVVIYVDSVVAWEDDDQKNNFTVTKTSITNGFNFKIVPSSNFAYEATIPVRVTAEDLIGTASDFTYSFYVSAEPPEVVAQVPEPDSSADVSTNVEISVEHKYGIRLNSIKIWIKPSNDGVFELAFDGSTPNQFVSGYDGPAREVFPLPKGFKIVLDRLQDFTMGDRVTAHVHVAAND